MARLSPDYNWRRLHDYREACNKNERLKSLYCTCMYTGVARIVTATRLPLQCSFVCRRDSLDCAWSNPRYSLYEMRECNRHWEKNKLGRPPRNPSSKCHSHVYPPPCKEQTTAFESNPVVVSFVVRTLYPWQQEVMSLRPRRRRMKRGYNCRHR